jgi:hypothetical protein
LEDYLFKNRDPDIVANNNELRRFAETTNAYLFIDPFDYLCDEVRCRNTDDQERLIYSDVSHLSIHGSQFMIESIEKRLLELLRKTSD